MRVLVTGGAGYIGSHTVIELLGQGHEACIVDNYVNSSPEVLTRVRGLTNGNFVAHEADVRDVPTLAEIMVQFRPDAVIHFAGLKAVGDSMADPLGYYDVNLRGTLAVLRAMEDAACRRIIFSSSATVYGEPVYLPYDEAHPLNPTSVYGRTKMMSELVIGDWAAATPGACAALLRYFNPVGAHASARLGEDPAGVPNNLMPFIAQVATGRRARLSVWGNDYDTPDGTGMRDYIHVVDLARAHVSALDWASSHTGARPFNIGTGKSHSVMEMLAAFEAASGRKIPYQVEPRRAGDIAAMQANPARAEAEMGWKATHSLADMATSTWKWQSANPDGYAKG